MVRLSFKDKGLESFFFITQDAKMQTIMPVDVSYQVIDQNVKNVSFKCTLHF